jgi:hypothetical protein
MAKEKTQLGIVMLIVVLNVRFLLKWCEWEQKFISGIDPTIAWQDIIAMVLRFIHQGVILMDYLKNLKQN